MALRRRAALVSVAALLTGLCLYGIVALRGIVPEDSSGNPSTVGEGKGGQDGPSRSPIIIPRVLTQLEDVPAGRVEPLREAGFRVVSYRARVVDSEGKPVEGARVQAFVRIAGFRGDRVTFTTNSEGVFGFDELLAERVAISRVEREGFVEVFLPRYPIVRFGDGGERSEMTEIRMETSNASPSADNMSISGVAEPHSFPVMIDLDKNRSSLHRSSGDWRLRLSVELGDDPPRTGNFEGRRRAWSASLQAIGGQLQPVGEDSGLSWDVPESGFEEARVDWSFQDVEDEDWQRKIVEQLYARFDDGTYAYVSLSVIPSFRGRPVVSFRVDGRVNPLGRRLERPRDAAHRIPPESVGDEGEECCPDSKAASGREYFVRIVDQASEAVSDVAVTVGSLSLRTDADGRVKVPHLADHVLVNASVADAEDFAGPPPAGNWTILARPGTTVGRSAEQPLELRAWRQVGELEPMMSRALIFKVVADGTPYVVDVLRPHEEATWRRFATARPEPHRMGSGDLVIRVNRELEATTRFARSFSVEVEAIDGGVQLAKDDFMFEAPEHGYSRILRIPGPNPSTTNFYAKLRDGSAYAGLRIDVNPSPYRDRLWADCAEVQILGHVNPMASRNLQRRLDVRSPDEVVQTLDEFIERFGDPELPAPTEWPAAKERP